MRLKMKFRNLNDLPEEQIRLLVVGKKPFNMPFLSVSRFSFPGRKKFFSFTYYFMIKYYADSVPFLFLVLGTA